METSAQIQNLLFSLLDQFVVRHNNQDLVGILQLYQPSSLVFDATEKTMMRIFSNHRIALQVNDRRFITWDGDYAYLRASMSSVNLDDGSVPRATAAETLIIFRFLNDRWGIWCQFPIEIQASVVS